MLTAKQLEERKRGIGGSDAAVALGMSPWATPRDLYEQKTSDVPSVEVTEGPMLWGTLIEPLLRQRYAEKTGRVVRLPDTIWSDRYPFMLAHLDGVTDCGRGYEAKTARVSDDWGEPGSDQIPLPYLIQVQHCMIVAQLEVFDVHVLIGGSEERYYEVRADRELQEQIIDGEAAFWSSVVTRTPPEIDLSAPNAIDLLRRIYPGTDGSEIIASDSDEAWRLVMDEAYDKASEYKATAEQAKAHLLARMQSAATLKFASGHVLRRALVNRKAYAVEASTYIEARIVRAKEK